MVEFVLNSNEIDKFISYIKNFCGINLSSKKDIIYQKIKNFAQENKIETYNQLIAKMTTQRDFRQSVVNLMTVNETYFYRELRQLQAVIEYTISLEKRVKILCAPCSSGEEVFSLGMISKAMGLGNFNIHITGIDIDSNMIERSKEAIYSQRSLNRLNEAQISMFFESFEDQFRVKKALLPKCEFHTMNIFNDEIFKLGTFDIILSRNMMIYFDEEFRLRCVERFHRLLNPSGRLYVGHADLVPNTTIFTKFHNLSGIYYEKV